MDDPAIYHITHLENLARIIAADRLWSDAQRIRQGINCTNIGHHHIKERRLRRRVPVAAGGMLGEYVPFNFCSRSVMLYAIHCGHNDYNGGQKPIVHLVSRVSAAVASGRPCAYTDRHAELAYAQYSDDTEQLDIVDWSVMPLRYWAGDSETREKRQAEFLVHDYFPWSNVLRIGVYGIDVAEAVTRLLASAKHKPNVIVKREWYYP